MIKRRSIVLTRPEIQSGYNRQRAAEGLILQLPKDHDGRNTWLLNFGEGEEAIERRRKRDLKWQPNLRAAESRNQQLERQAS